MVRVQKSERRSIPRRDFVSDRQFGSRWERDLPASRVKHRDHAVCQCGLSRATRVADQYGIWLKPGRSLRRRERLARPSTAHESTDLTRYDTTVQRMVNAAISPGQKFITRSFLVTISNRSGMLSAPNLDERSLTSSQSPRQTRVRKSENRSQLMNLPERPDNSRRVRVLQPRHPSWV